MPPPSLCLLATSSKKVVATSDRLYCGWLKITMLATVDVGNSVWQKETSPTVFEVSFNKDDIQL